MTTATLRRMFHARPMSDDSPRYANVTASTTEPGSARYCGSATQ
jgi:hypothetical protein